jgi:glycosyltransferase involved in cell wall biosynthesis
MAQLSIIVIGRNEAAHIEMCLRSLFASLAGRDDFEVIYVDSASDDDTVEIAQRFPIHILQLRRDWILTPAAGRFVGFQHATGKYLLFVDGDTVIYKQWIEKSMRFLDENPSFGAIAGIMHQAFQNADGRCVAVQKNHFGQSSRQSVQIATTLGGIAMYRREAMEKAGTFNPFLSTGEECEVALRIQRSGYQLGRIFAPMCITYSMPRESVTEIMRRSRSRLYDYGTTLRYCLANGNGLKFSVAQMSFVFSFLGAVIAGLVTIAIAAWTGNTALLLIGVVGALAYLAVKRRHPKLFAISLLKRSMMTYRTVRSFICTTILPVEAYPTDVVIVK